MIVYHSYDDYYQDISWFGFLMKKKVFKHEACWKDPRWKYLPARFIAGLMRATPEVSKSYVTDKRQEFLLEDILIQASTVDCFVELACIMRDMMKIPCC